MRHACFESRGRRWLLLNLQKLVPRALLSLASVRPWLGDVCGGHLMPEARRKGPRSSTIGCCYCSLGHLAGGAVGVVVVGNAALGFSVLMLRQACIRR
ncbi:hypothetical protein K432DRAFT_94428 [Lepidopterella palustris CBS 459.81]|uniref:Uncharacterized protein n=1 Tax=Lepidopterella palustris CBS 459.81 TaxID=1314670 RepID=A0A8E2EIT9_9PEZI|nr:hypothetical protein K432DRAFT_94428 [Lepidopterella palustris CBS 459.81]